MLTMRLCSDHQDGKRSDIQREVIIVSIVFGYKQRRARQRALFTLQETSRHCIKGLKHKQKDNSSF